MNYQIVLVGISHKTAPVEIREQISFTKNEIGRALDELGKIPSVIESVIISTCNRVEIYAVTSEVDKCIEDIKDFVFSFHKIPVGFPESKFYVLVQTDAVRHLYKVTSSIDSMVIGEPQILGQVKEFYRKAFQSGSTGIILNRLFQSSFFTAKKVRSETKIGSNAVSVSYLTVELAKRIFEDLSARSVMLIGTGEMGELSARYLMNSGVSNLIISSRNFENAYLLSQKLNGEPIKLEEIYYRLKDVDIVITATGSSDFIIKEDHIHQALKLRKNEPMFLIDIAVPRDIDPRIEDISGVYLYDVDDLQNVMEKNVKSRFEHAKQAELIINDIGKSFSKWLEGLKVLPTIIELKAHFEQVKYNELNKALRKLGNMEEREQRIIENMATGIVEKLMHHPVTNLKRESSTSLGTLYADTVKQLFGLDESFDLIDELDEEAEDRN